uniref:SGL domain-containing protein n=1 Tax=Macrostomum lignano TaxID=282301 RepID=A0A1I8HVN6_9PLAT
MSSNYTVNCLLDSVAKTCGEGPFWEPVTKTLYFVSIADGEVHLWSEPNNYHSTIQVGEQPGNFVSFVIPCQSGGFLAGINKSIVHCDWQAGELKRRVLHKVDPQEPIRFNDAKCDPAGRLLAGTMSLEKEAGLVMKPGAGSLFGLDLDGSIKTLDTGFSLSNGLGWHGNTFYFTDSVARVIYAYDWDAEAFSISNRRVAIDFSKLPEQEKLGVPDGLAVDADGRLWVACFFGSRVLCLDPQSGQVVSQIPMPVPNVTSCCFGSDGELFVTTANHWGVREGEQPPPQAGSVFRVTGLDGIRGTPSVIADQSLLKVIKMPSNYTVNCLLDSVAKTVGEGPFWEPVTKTLYFVSAFDGAVHLWSEPNNYHSTIQVTEKQGSCVSFVIPCQSGGFLAGINNTIVHCDWQAGELKRRVLREVDPQEPIRFNDAKCDPAGRLLAGTMSWEKEAAVLMKPEAGSLFGLDLDGSIKRLDTGFSISNGLGWHGNTFYFTDSLARVIYAYDWDAEGCYRLREAARAGEAGVPDGLAVDADGRLWVACFFGSRVLCLDPQSGQVVSQIPMPVPNVTSCCFGSDGELFVTTANHWGVREGEQPPPQAGSVFRVTGLDGIRGTPSVIEGPFWEPVTKTLYFVSIFEGEVHLWNEPNNYHSTVKVSEQPVSFVIPCQSGGFLAGASKSIVHCDWQAGELKRRVLHEVDPGLSNRFNDAKCDPAGRLLAGTMSLETNAGAIMKPNAGSLFGLDLGGSIKTMETGVSLSNGLGWHGNTFYFTDSPVRTIYAYDWDAEGFSISNRRVAIDFSKLPEQEKLGFPDGLAVDADGRLWVACFYGSRVLCLDPQSGQVVSQIPMPVPNVTSCCFGSDGELFVTTANQWGVRDGEQPPPQAGSIFRVTGLDGIRGTPSVMYKGSLPPISD